MGDIFRTIWKIIAINDWPQEVKTVVGVFIIILIVIRMEIMNQWPGDD